MLHTVAASNNRDHLMRSLYHCLFPHAYIFVLCADPARGESHINATPPERLQQYLLLYTTNRTDHTFFVWRLNLARPSHPGHSNILLRSEIPSGMCAKFHTVAASNNRDHASQSLLLLLARATYIAVLFFTHIPFVLNPTINAPPLEGLQQYKEDIGPRAAVVPEVQRWAKKWKKEDVSTVSSSAIEALCACHADIYPNVYILLTILGTLPVSTATSERSFNTMFLKPI